MTAACEARIAELEAVVGRQAVQLARLEGARTVDVDPLRGLIPIKRRVVAAIVENVAAAFHVDRDDIVGPTRDGYLIQPRFAAVWLGRALTGLSLMRLAPVFGYLDHTSIIHALRRAEGWRETDPDFAAVTDRIAERIAADRAGWRA